MMKSVRRLFGGQNWGILNSEEILSIIEFQRRTIKDFLGRIHLIPNRKGERTVQSSRMGAIGTL